MSKEQSCVKYGQAVRLALASLLQCRVVSALLSLLPLSSPSLLLLSTALTTMLTTMLDSIEREATR